MPLPVRSRRLPRARIVRQIRRRWPRVRILLRADSGFCRDALMIWYEANRVDYVFGLARNARLVTGIGAELAAAEAGEHRHRKAGPPVPGLHMAHTRPLGL